MTTDRFGWLRILAYLCLLFLGMLSVSAQGQTHSYCPTDGVCTYSKAQTMSGGLKTSPFNTLLGYGCAHDGTDASSCVNTVFAGSSGSTIWLEPGYTYTVASTVVQPGGLNVLAAGNVDGSAGVAAFAYTGNGTAWNVSSTTTAWVYANRLSGFRIYSTTGAAAICLNLDRVAEFEMDHMTIGGGNGNGCGIGVNVAGISSGSVHDNRITWNTKAMIIDGYAAGTSFGATSSSANDFFNNVFFECSNGIQLKNLWSSTFRRNYFEACDNWFYINAADGTMDSNAVGIVNVDIAYNKGTKGGDVAHVTPHPLRVTGAGTLGINTRDFTMHGNLWDTGGVDNAILIDSTTAGSVNIVLKSYENRFSGANNVYVSASKTVNLTDNGNTYYGPDGLTTSTPIYSGAGIVLNNQQFTGLAVSSPVDSTATSSWQCGLTSDQICQIQFKDKSGTVQGTISKDAGNSFTIKKGTSLIQFGTGATAIEDTTAAGITVNDAANTTGLTRFFGGGASPAERVRISDAGIKADLTNGAFIKSTLNGSATLTYTAIAANTCQEQTITVTGSTSGKPAFFSPAATLGNTNLSWSSWVSATNTVSVRVCNPTVGSITPSAVAWAGWVLQ